MENTIVADMPNETYHADAAVGSSGLKLIDQSPLHYWAAYLDPNRKPREATQAMKIGTAWHCAVFEPDEFEARYVEIPAGLDRRTKEGKALWEEISASGREPMTPDGWEQIQSMAASARRHPVSRVLFEQCDGVAEQSLFWTDAETGVRCKIRPDYAIAPCKLFPNGLLIDGKTGEDMSAEGFAKYAWNWQLHLQAAFYADGFRQVYRTAEPPAFMWLAQEKAAPYATALYSGGADFIEFGRRKYRQLLRVYAECRRTDTWPGYPETVTELALPVWAEKQVQEGVKP